MTGDLPQNMKDVVAQLRVDDPQSVVQYADRNGQGVWRVTGGDCDLAVRFRPFGGDRSLADEFNRMDQAADAGVSPRPVAHDVDAGWLAYQWVDGDPMSPSAAPTNAELQAVAITCARLHASTPFGGQLADPVASFEADVAKLGVATQVLPDGFDAWRDRAVELGQCLMTTAPLAPCHNDIFPANLINAGDRHLLVDWEYAADGDPACDLASFAVSSSLGLAQVEALVKLYSEASLSQSIAPEATIPRVRAWMIVSAVAWLPWALADDTMPPESKAIWTEWARLRYENITTGITSLECEQLIERCA